MKQLGITVASHSTLSYSDVHHPWGLYQQIFFSLFAWFQSKVKRKKKFGFKNKFLILDPTIFNLCLRIFNWTRSHWTKGAIELPPILDHDGYVASLANIPQGNIADNTIVRGFPFDWGIVIVNNRCLRISGGKSS